MRIITEDLPDRLPASKLLGMYFSGRRPAVIDIETTGLSAAKNKVILAGFVFFTKDGLKAMQIFADSREEEKELLERTASYIKKCDVLVSYNGASFDEPFLRRRMKLHGIDDEEVFSGRYHIDLLKIIKKYSQLRDILPDLRQKTVERYMGLSEGREDEISGGESVELYNRYCRLTKDLTDGERDALPHDSKAGILLDTILLHNRDDIVCLSRLTAIAKSLDIHQIMFREGWPGVKNIRFESDCLCADGELPVRIPLESFEDSKAADLISLGLESTSLSALPGCESGYLILVTGGAPNFLEINSLINEIIKLSKNER